LPDRLAEGPECPLHHRQCLTHVFAKQDATRDSQRQAGHRVVQVNHAGRPQPPLLAELLDLLAHGGGVAGHPLGCEQRLQEPLLALPLAILTGQHPVAKGATDLAVENGVLAVVRPGIGEHSMRRVGVKQQVKLQAQPRWAGQEPHHVAVLTERLLTCRRQVAAQVERRPQQK
jgi:hypothetical protein